MLNSKFNSYRILGNKQHIMEKYDKIQCPMQDTYYNNSIDSK